MEKVVAILVVILSLTMAQTPLQYEAYFGLLPAQIDYYELAGIDLYLDSLTYIATMAIAVALSLPLTQVDFDQVLNNLLSLVE